MQGHRRQFLAGAALAGNQHIDIHLTQFFDLRQHLPHQRRFTDDAIHFVRFGQFAVQILHPRLQAEIFDRLAEQHPQLVHVERLGDVVESAGPHRSHRRMDTAERGHHDDDQRRFFAFHLLQHFHAVRLSQFQVEQHDIDILLPDCFQRCLRRMRLKHPEFILQGKRQRRTNRRFIIHNQQITHLSSAPPD